MFFPKFVYMTKNIPFFPVLHVFAPLNDVRAYSNLGLKNNTNYVIFWTSLIPPLTFEWPPPGLIIDWFLEIRHKGSRLKVPYAVTRHIFCVAKKLPHKTYFE